MGKLERKGKSKEGIRKKMVRKRNKNKRIKAMNENASDRFSSLSQHKHEMIVNGRKLFIHKISRRFV